MKIDKTTIGLVYNGGFYPLGVPLNITYPDGTRLRGEIVCFSFVSASSRALLTVKLFDETRFITVSSDEIKSAVSLSDLEVVV